MKTLMLGIRLLTNASAVLCLSAVAFYLPGCNSEEPARTDLFPRQLRVGVLPDEGEQRLRERFNGLQAYLDRSLDTECVLVVPESYAHLLELFHAGTIDLAYFGGVTFVQAHAQDGAIPLVMRDVDERLTSLVLVRPGTEAGSIHDLKGASFSFGSELSTSGHFMPRQFFEDQGIAPESFFAAVRYSGAHDVTAYWVRDGEVDVGVVNASVFRNMLIDGRIMGSDVHVLWESPPYAGYVWAASPTLSADARREVRDAFLALSFGNAEHAPILKDLGAYYFLPANFSNFKILETAVLSFQHRTTADDSE